VPPPVTTAILPAKSFMGAADLSAARVNSNSGYAPK
jgi:hypothetical protein